MDTTATATQVGTLKKLHKILAQICDPDPVMQENGGRAFYRAMQGSNLHPDDLVLEVSGDYGDQLRSRVIEHHKVKEKQYLIVIAYLQRTVDAKMMAAAWAAMNITYRWPEFTAALRERFGGKPPGKEQIARMLKISVKTLADWEKGTKEIREAAIEAVMLAEVPPPLTRTPKKAKLLVAKIESADRTAPEPAALLL